MISESRAHIILTRLGFRVNTDARYDRGLRDFQAAWAIGTALVIDGILGERTSDALELSLARLERAGGSLSKYFDFDEFACRCNGKYSTCRRIRGEGKSGTRPLRTLVLGLDELREKHYAGGLRIVSGYRCASHNQAVDGAPTSQHLFGAAADIGEVIKVPAMKDLDRFSGIGVDGSSGKVRHVDVRHASGHNTTGASISSPTVWTYGA